MIFSNDLTMLNYFYVLIAISRYLRIFYFVGVMREQYNDFSDVEVERHIYKLSLIIFCMIVVQAGWFVEIENSQNLDSIVLDRDI